MPILVVGSIVVDIICISEKLPLKNETLIADKMKVCPGGKGANQALAASKFGSIVTLVSCIGNDLFAEIAKINLSGSNINLQYIKTINGQTAIGLLQSSKNGETQILMFPGVLNILGVKNINKHLFKKNHIFLCQLELPKKEVIESINIAFRHKMTIIFNYTPTSYIDAEILNKVTYIILNEPEANTLSDILNIKYDNFGHLCYEVAKFYNTNVIITLGEEGSFIYFNNSLYKIPTKFIKPVDPAGSGDAFCGTFASALDIGYTILESIQFATAAGALVCKGIGAQEPLANDEEIKKFKKYLIPPIKIM